MSRAWQPGQLLFAGFEGTEVPADLGALIAEAVERNPDQKVTVRGDRGTSYANIVRVLDACKGNGVREPYLDTVMTGAGGS